MVAILETVDLINGRGTYRVQSDSGLVMRSAVPVTGTIQDSTTVGQMKTAARNHLIANAAAFKADWRASVDVVQLQAINSAWDEAVA